MPEVMTIEIAAVVTMDDADAVDCQHGEDEALESAVVQDITTKRSSAVTKEHGYEAAPDKSLLDVDGMVGGSASLSRSCAMLIPQVRPARKYPISPWEMIHLPGGG
jgi:hypothetical protein